MSGLLVLGAPSQAIGQARSARPGARAGEAVPVERPSAHGLPEAARRACVRARVRACVSVATGVAGLVQMLVKQSAGMDLSDLCLRQAHVPVGNLIQASREKSVLVPEASTNGDGHQAGLA